MATEHIMYRPLRRADLAALRLLHQQMFPIDYDASFYEKAASGDSTEILGWAAVLPQFLAPVTRLPTPTTVFVDGEQLLGFVTVRPCSAADLPPVDRRLLGLEGAAHADTREYRRAGVGRALLQLSESRAAAMGCLAAYLHVIDYNAAAIAFYQRNYYQEVVRLRDFYFIQTGRALQPDKRDYDACFFVKRLQAPHPASGGALWASLDALASWLPLRRWCAGCTLRRYKEDRPRGGGHAPDWLMSLFRRV